MKTEQEQIEEIVKILVESSKKCRYTDCNNCDYQHVKDCAQYRKAVALVQAGYGDVKQAKIDVFNELKKRIYDISPYNPLVAKDNVKYYIDKLIKEVEND